jgi:hypothetical protein
MLKTPFTYIMASAMALFLVSACAEDSKDPETTTAQVSAPESAGNAGDDSTSIMDQPMDFSTAENVEISLQKIREQEGDEAYKTLNSAMKYVKYYDLSISNNMEKLYKKLDGKTPNEIIAMMKR